MTPYALIAAVVVLVAVVKVAVVHLLARRTDRRPGFPPPGAGVAEPPSHSGGSANPLTDDQLRRLWHMLELDLIQHRGDPW